MTLTTDPAGLAGNVAAATTTTATCNTSTSPSEENSESQENTKSDEKSKSAGSNVFASNIVQLHVGPEQKVYTAHKAVLTRIPFFHKCLNKNFVEGTTNVVKLPEEDVTAVECVLHYAYTDSLVDTGALPKNEATVEYGLKLVRAYILVDKWCMEDLENKLTDHFRSYYRKYKVEPDHISMLRECGLANSQLRRLMLRNLAYRLRTVGWDGYVQCGGSNARWETALQEHVKKGGEDVLDLLKTCMHITNVSSPLDGNPCDWHKHVSTPTCTPP